MQRMGGAKDKGGFVVSHKAKSTLQHAPGKEYFNELFRVSKHQIVFGGNYFTKYLPPSMAWIYWNKQNGDSYFSDGELGWTSFGCGLREVKKSSVQPNRIHPTQKPVYLYRWILEKYLPNAFSGRKVKMRNVLDTHLGSGNIAIACHINDIDLTACEIDEVYYKKAMNNIKNNTSQQSLFKGE